MVAFTKKALIFLTASLCAPALAGFIFTSQASAQTASPSAQPQTTFAPQLSADKALADYNYTYDQYLQAHSAYQVAKNEYQTYGTLSSQQKAIDATQTMMTWRADTIRTYLIALRQKLLETPGLTPADYVPLVISNDNEVAWIQDQKSAIPSAGSLTDLANLSQSLESKYPELELLYYQTLTQILSGNEEDLRQEVQSLADQAKLTITGLKAQGVQTDVFERWLLEAQTRLDRAQNQHDQAFSLLAGMSSQYSTSSQARALTYSQIQSAFGQENIYLQDALNMLTQIIQEAANAGV